MGLISSTISDGFKLVVLAVRALLDQQRSFSAVLTRIQTPAPLPSSHPTVSAWQEPAHPFPTLPLPDEVVDVLIIGSGITGTAIAHELLGAPETAGMRIALVDARGVCSGATGRNGGHVKYAPYEEYARLLKHYGASDCADIVRFRRRHLAELLQFAQSLGQEAAAHSEMREVETLDVYFDQAGFDKAAEHLDTYLRDFPDEKAAWGVYAGEEARTKFAVPRACGVLVFKAGALSPYNLVTTALEQLSARHPNFSVHPLTPIVFLAPSVIAGLTMARTAAGGLITARHVVHATNGYLSHLLPGFAGKVFPVRGTMTAQAPGARFPHKDGERSWSFIWQKGFDYCIQRPDGTIMLGGGLLNAEDDGLVDIGAPADDAAHVSVLAAAHLRGLPPTVFGDAGWGASAGGTTWTGVMGWSADTLPFIGAVGPEATGRASSGAHEWVCGGYGGEGMVNAWLCGAALGRMLRGASDGLPAPFRYSAARLRKARIVDHVDDYFGQ